MKKGQAALEFLTTYGWAFLTILVTLGALYYFGLFDFGKYSRQECVFTSQFPCIDFAFDEDEVRIKLLNNIGEMVNLTDASITNNAGAPLTCLDPAWLSGPGYLEWDDDEEIDLVFSSCTDGAFFSGESADADVTFVYYAVNTPSQPLHTVNGRVSAIVG